MSIPDQGRILLALDTGIRETGWAVFHNGRVEATGAIAVPRRRGMSAAVKVEHLIKSLDGLAKQWQPDAVACCQPSGIGWRMTALDFWTPLWRTGRIGIGYVCTLIPPGSAYCYRRASQRTTGPDGLRRDGAVWADRAEQDHPGVGSHCGRTLPPDPVGRRVRSFIG